ncbi:MAG TPA: CehA/McbA family metallohydrolase [bacterium]
MTLRIHDPYAVAGEYRRAQLHCHTTESDGTFRPEELLRMYKAAGYAFVFITDHNRVTRCDSLDDETFLALPGSEDTVSKMRPLGPHLLRMFATAPARGADPQRVIDETVAAGGICGLCHPSWTGNLWTGAWPERAVAALRGYHFIEIRNPHSRPQDDTARWEAALRRSTAPVWGVAVDDCHTRAQFNRGWITIRVPRISATDLKRALQGGAFYASTGPAAEFGVEGTTITARFEEPLSMRFIDARSQVRMAVEGTDGGYAVHGDEQYIRVEASRGRYAVWSQPFVIDGDRSAGVESGAFGHP